MVEMSFWKSRWEKRVWLQVLQRRISSGMFDGESGFSVFGGIELAGEGMISDGAIKVERMGRFDVLDATFRPSRMEQPVCGSPQTTFPHVRQ